MDGNGIVNSSDYAGMNACKGKLATDKVGVYSCSYVDLNGDGKVDDADINDIVMPRLNKTIDRSTCTQTSLGLLKRGDVNGDGLVDSNDAVLLRGFITSGNSYLQNPYFGQPGSVELRGDVNYDTDVTDIDADYTLKIAVGLPNPETNQPFTEDDKKRADVNMDGLVTSVDALFIKRFAARMDKLLGYKGDVNFDRDLTMDDVNKVCKLTTNSSYLIDKGGCVIKSEVLIDSRLYTKMKKEIARYISAAEKRRGFAILVRSIDGIDDWTHQQVKQYLTDLKNTTPSVEGILFMGNIKVPTFYKPRADILQSAIYPAYYEDLDGTFDRKQQPGSIDPLYDNTNNTLCNVIGNLEVPQHDFDYIAKGANPYPELWTSYMPVGYTDETKNNYDGYAAQLKPLLEKAYNFHNSGVNNLSGRVYNVTNNLFDLSDIWQTYGPSNLDYYSINPDTLGTTPSGSSSYQYCMRNRTAEQCYVKANTAAYSSFSDFQRFFQTKDWMGENWQQPNIFLNHMRSSSYDAVWVVTHGGPTFALISSSDAKQLVGGGPVVMLDGCSTGSITQPGSSSFVSGGVRADENLLLSYIYGSSNFIASLGDSLNRGHTSYFFKMIPWMKNGDYLGLSHLKRKQILYDLSDNPGELKSNVDEVLYGDPFLDLKK